MSYRLDANIESGSVATLTFYQTRAWALEVATLFPNAQVHGFDVSDEQFSPSYNIKNLTLSVHDAFEPFPQQFVGHFDIVHVRFFLCLVNDAVAPALVENLATLLSTYPIALGISASPITDLMHLQSLAGISNGSS